MSLTLEKIFEAKNRIAPYTMRTPLIRLESWTSTLAVRCI